MQTEGGVVGEVRRAAGRSPFKNRERCVTDAELRETVGVGGQRKRAAVVFSGGFNVKQWQTGWAEVNKD